MRYAWMNSLRYAVVILFLVSCGVALVPIAHLSIDNSANIWFYEKDPGIAEYRKDMATFGEWDWMILHLHTPVGIYQTDFLETVRRVTEKIADLPDVTKVVSTANARLNARTADGMLNYKRLLGEPPWDLAGLRAALERNPVFRDGLIKSGNASDALILIQTAVRFGDTRPYREMLVNRILALVAAEPLLAQHALVGAPYLNVALNRASRHDMFVFFPAVTVLVTALAWLVLPHWHYIVVLYAVLAGTVLWTIGGMLAYYSFNMVTIMLPAVLMSLSATGIIHFLTTYHAVRVERPDLSTPGALKHTIRSLWVPSLMAAVTTGQGFASLTQTPIVPVTLVGAFAALGIGIAFILTFTLAPLLLRLLGTQGERQATCIEVWSAGFSQQVTKRYVKLTDVVLVHPKKVLLIAFVVLGGLSTGLAYLDADTDYVGMFRDRTRVAQGYRQVEAAGFGTSNITLAIATDRGIDDPEVLQSLYALEAAIAQFPEVRKTIGPAVMLTEIDRALADEPQQWTPGFAGYSREGVAQLILLAQISGNDDLADVLAADQRSARLFVFTKYMSSKDIERFASQLLTLARTLLPDGVQSTVTGLSVLWANMDTYLINAQVSSLLALVGVLFLTFLITVRSLWLALVGLIVNVLPTMALLGLMSWLGVKIDMATTLIGGITMGITVDDTLFFLWHYRQELKAGIPGSEALRSTVRHKGVAITSTAALLVGGFQIMAWSDFYPVANFGIFTSLTLAFCVIVEAVLLPILLMVPWRLRSSPSLPAPAQGGTIHVGACTL